MALNISRVPGPAIGTFVANNDAIAAVTLPVKIPCSAFIFGIECARAALEAQSLLACNFCNCALGRQISLQDHQVAIFFDWNAQGPQSVVHPDKRPRLLQGVKLFHVEATRVSTRRWIS